MLRGVSRWVSISLWRVAPSPVMSPNGVAFWSTAWTVTDCRKQNNKSPEAAVAYGRALLAKAEAAETAGLAPMRRRTILSWFGLAKTAERVAVGDQLDIVRAAGRW
jgi:hypothetical protein